MVEKIIKQMKQIGVIYAEEEPLYEYGLELLLNALANIIVMFIIGSLFNELLPTLVFMTFYMILKIDTGGYHADSHFGCIFQFNYFYILIMICYKVGVFQQEWILLTGCVLTIILIWLLAPVAAVNKPISDEMYIKHYRNSRTKSILLIGIIIVIAYFKAVPERYITFSMLGYMVVGITILMGYIKNQIRLKRGEESAEDSNLR